MKKQYISWREFGELMDTLAQDIKTSGSHFDGIIGISRGGLPLAVSLSHALDLPISQIIRAASYDETNQQGDLKILTQLPDQLDTDKKYLIVDDISDTGQTLDAIKKLFPKSQTCALFLKPHASHQPDFWIQEGDTWIVFPWEM